VPEGVQGLDRYAYTNNNPLNYTDPTGHCTSFWNCVATGFAVAANLVGQATEAAKSTANSYAQGWDNFNTAVSIASNPNASAGDRLMAGGYALTWGGAHVAIVAGLVVACAGNQSCVDTVTGTVRTAEENSDNVSTVSQDTVSTISTAETFVKPDWVNDASTFSSWMKNIEKDRTILSTENIGNLIKMANDYGVDYRVDPGHANTPWDMPHINFGDQGFHVIIPPDYKLPE
jgi:hypothetical protein